MALFFHDNRRLGPAKSDVLSAQHADWL